MNPPREFLGREIDLASRKKVFLIPDALEVDEASFLRIERTRVYFDDVLALTRHAQVGVFFAILMGLCTLLFGGIALAVLGASPSEPAVAIAFACAAAPFAIALVLRLAMKVDVITVYGKRTKARMMFSFRKGRARQIYEDLARRIRSRQDSIANSVLPPPPPPAPAEPPPPPSLPPPAEPPAPA